MDTFLKLMPNINWISNGMTKEDGVHHLEIFERKVTCYDIYCCGLKFIRGKILTIL